MIMGMGGLKGTESGKHFYLQSIRHRDLSTVHCPQVLFKAARDLDDVQQGQRFDYDCRNFAVARKDIVCQIGPLAGQVKSP